MTTQSQTAPAPSRASWMRSFLRTPKGMLLVALLALLAIAIPVDGMPAVIRVAASVGAAVVTDVLFTRHRNQALNFPDGAILTGMIVAMVLSQTAPLYVPILASILAIASKHLIRVQQGHIFNPAAFGLLIASLLLSSEQSWWGGLGDLPTFFIVAVLIAGVAIADRVNKFPSVSAFAITYFGLFTVAAIAADPTSVSDIFREPFTGAALFFGFFMLTDPPTSPARPSDQVWFAIVVAVASFFIYTLTAGGVYYLLAGLLAGNAFEAVRRSAGVKTRRQRATSARAPLKFLEPETR